MGKSALAMNNPLAFRPGQPWPDSSGVPINAHGGGILHHDGVYYWFGEHKIAGEAGNRAHVGVHVYSSPDLYQWKDEGIALKVSDDPRSEIRRECILERPKVIYNRSTREFVMWFHLELKEDGYSSARSGVAVADRATGPYRYLHSQRPNAGLWPSNAPAENQKPLGETDLAHLRAMEFPGGPAEDYPPDLIYRRDFARGQMARDMTLFVDDDGAAYHIHASEENGTLHISRLSDDYRTSGDRYVRIFPGRFHEAPALMKYRGRYFLIASGCTGWFANAARLAVADSIWGPWQEIGNPCRGDEKQRATTFDSQSTYILPVANKSNAFIFMADRWRPENAIDGRYVWLPVQFDNGIPFLEWKDEWYLEFFPR
jgi:hypothetical protein